MRRLALALLLACGRPKSDGSSAAPALAPVDAGAVAMNAGDAARAPVVTLTELRTTALSGNEDYGALKNLRIAADEKGALITWERNSVPRLGDTSQVGFATFLERRADGADSMTSIALPARAYASAVYTTVAPTRVNARLDLFAYGVAGEPVFSTYAVGARSWKGIDVFTDAGPPAHASGVLPFMVDESLAVAATVPLAVLGGSEAPCESYYRCEPVFSAAMKRGLPKSVRAFSNPGKTQHTEILYRGTRDAPTKSFVPAIAAGPNAALAIYRVDAQLSGAWLTLEGKKQGDVSVAAAGEIGAPAVTFAGERAYAVWAARGSTSEPFRIWIARVGASGVEGAAYVDTGSSSAFAPAIAARGDALVIAWMEGDDGTRGRIRMGAFPRERIASTSEPIEMERITDVTEEGNHRDPEISTIGDRLYLVWSDFSARREGVPILRTFSSL